MTDPKTPQKLNEVVVNKLGLKYRFSQLMGESEGIVVKGCYKDFAGIPTDALWALERFCNDNECGVVFVRFDRQSWTCSIVDADNKTTGRGMGTFSEAISRAIAGTK